jgi:hypothetical protein
MKDGCFNFVLVGGWLNTSLRVCNHRTYIRIDITSPHGVSQKYEVLKPVLIYQHWSRGLMYVVNLP